MHHSIGASGWFTVSAGDGPDRMAQTCSLRSSSNSSGPLLDFRLRRFSHDCDALSAAMSISHSRSDLEVTPIFTKFQVVDFSGSDDFV
jgi:hypothetical protein